jgi:hypothetical protein
MKKAKVIFNNVKQLVCANNFGLEMKKKLVKSCICSVAVYGSETWAPGKNEERVVNAFETWCWRRILKIKWTGRVTNDEVFQRAKEERWRLKKNDATHGKGIQLGIMSLKQTSLKEQYPEKKGHGKTSTTILKASRQNHSS